MVLGSPSSALYFPLRGCILIENRSIVRPGGATSIIRQSAHGPNKEMLWVGVVDAFVSGSSDPAALQSPSVFRASRRGAHSQEVETEAEAESSILDPGRC